MRLAIIIPVSIEPLPLLSLCLQHVRKAYAKEPVVVVGDGVAGDYVGAAAKFGASFVASQPLKRGIVRHPWWLDNIMRICLDTGADWILRLDPDTKVWRPWQNVPVNSLACGQVLMSGEKRDIPTLNSCAALWSRELCQKYFGVSRDVWDELPTLYKNDLMARQLFCEDHWMPFIFRRMGVVIDHSNEVGGAPGREPPENLDLKFAATHAHKTYESWFPKPKPAETEKKAEEKKPE